MKRSRYGMSQGGVSGRRAVGGSSRMMRDVPDMGSEVGEVEDG